MGNFMRVLVLGLINSQWTFQFTKTFLQNNNHEVWMVKRGNDNESRKWISQYRQIGVNFIDCTKIVATMKEVKVQRNFWLEMYAHLAQLKEIVGKGRFDIIHVHYMDLQDVKYAPILKYLTGSKLVYSYWGSDLFRVNKKQLNSRGMIVRQADFITFDNRDLELKFKEIYAWAHKIPSKTILFGLPVLDIIRDRRKQITDEKIREEWKVPKDKQVVAIGYSATDAHQHIKVLKRIEKLDLETRDRLFIVLQMTYGGTAQYIKRVTAAAEKTGCEYRVIRNYLTDEEVADLRIMTDIYINAQMTDAFSGSVCENLFAGTILINAKWLCYQEFKDHDFQYLEFKNMGEIDQLIKLAMGTGIDVSKNKSLVWQLRSWECCEPKWQRIYQSLI